jgi:hypothetical protein
MTPPLPHLPANYTFTGWDNSAVAHMYIGHVMRKSTSPPYNAHIVVVPADAVSQDAVDGAAASAIRNLEEIAKLRSGT